MRRVRLFVQSGKVDVVVVLAAVPYQEAVKLAILANDAVDFVVLSSPPPSLRGSALSSLH